MKKFQIHFDNKGNVLVNNISGVNPNTSECVQVTKPYVESLGKVSDMVMLNEQPLPNYVIELETE